MVSPLREYLEIIFFRSGYNTNLALIAAFCLGVASGLVGCFLILRKQALLSDAMSHATLPGLVMAALVVKSLGIVRGAQMPFYMAGAFLFALLGVYWIARLSKSPKLSPDVAIASVLTIFFGAGVVGISYLQTLNMSGQPNIMHFIFGQIAGVGKSDVILIMMISLLAILTVLVMFRELFIMSFDRDYALFQGIALRRIDVLFLCLVGGVMMVGLQTVGMILIIALLIIPAAAARLWTARLKRMCFLAGLFGGLSGFLGAGLSAIQPQWPTGAVIVLCAGTLFVVSFLLGPWGLRHRGRLG